MYPTEKRSYLKLRQHCIFKFALIPSCCTLSVGPIWPTHSRCRHSPDWRIMNRTERPLNGHHAFTITVTNTLDHVHWNNVSIRCKAFHLRSFILCSVKSTSRFPGFTAYRLTPTLLYTQLLTVCIKAYGHQQNNTL